MSPRANSAAPLCGGALEDGAQLDGTTSTADCAEMWRGEVAGSWITRRRFELAVDLPPGYHEFEARIAGGETDHCLLIVSPPKCFEPAAIARGPAAMGHRSAVVYGALALQLGHRGFQRLGNADSLGGGVRRGLHRLNPLHALAPADPASSSPYSASSRHFLNVLYIAVPAVPEFAAMPGRACTTAKSRKPSSVERAARARAATVDYVGVADLKLEILALLYHDFRDKHLATRSARARSSQASWPSAVRRCNCMRDSMRWTAIFAPP